MFSRLNVFQHTFDVCVSGCVNIYVNIFCFLLVRKENLMV